MRWRTRNELNGTRDLSTPSSDTTGTKDSFELLHFLANRPIQQGNSDAHCICFTVVIVGKCDATEESFFMIHYELVQAEGILIVSLEASTAASDFQRLSEEIDPYIEARGRLQGLMIDAEAFPSRGDFTDLIAHLHFVERHHKHIAKLAIVSDDRYLSAARTFASHFVPAEVRHFAHQQKRDAYLWLTTVSQASDRNEMPASAPDTGA